MELIGGFGAFPYLRRPTFCGIPAAIAQGAAQGSKALRTFESLITLRDGMECCASVGGPAEDDLRRPLRGHYAPRKVRSIWSSIMDLWWYGTVVGLYAIRGRGARHGSTWPHQLSLAASHGPWSPRFHPLPVSHEPDTRITCSRSIRLYCGISSPKESGYDTSLTRQFQIPNRGNQGTVHKGRPDRALNNYNNSDTRTRYRTKAPRVGQPGRFGSGLALWQQQAADLPHIAPL